MELDALAGVRFVELVAALRRAVVTVALDADVAAAETGFTSTVALAAGCDPDGAEEEVLAEDVLAAGDADEGGVDAGFAAEALEAALERRRGVGVAMT